jgi:hypothetical protein
MGRIDGGKLGRRAHRRPDRLRDVPGRACSSLSPTASSEGDARNTESPGSMQVVTSRFPHSPRRRRGSAMAGFPVPPRLTANAMRRRSSSAERITRNAAEAERLPLHPAMRRKIPFYILQIFQIVE